MHSEAKPAPLLLVVAQRRQSSRGGITDPADFTSDLGTAAGSCRRHQLGKGPGKAASVL
jgi:hypothetical protein